MLIFKIELLQLIALALTTSLQLWSKEIHHQCSWQQPWLEAEAITLESDIFAKQSFIWVCSRMKEGQCWLFATCDVNAYHLESTNWKISHLNLSICGWLWAAHTDAYLSFRHLMKKGSAVCLCQTHQVIQRLRDEWSNIQTMICTHAHSSETEPIDQRKTFVCVKMSRGLIYQKGCRTATKTRCRLKSRKRRMPKTFHIFQIYQTVHTHNCTQFHW